jgi:hypothetical protein
VTILSLRLRFYLLAAETESKLLSGPSNRTEVSNLMYPGITNGLALSHNSATEHEHIHGERA